MRKRRLLFDTDVSNSIGLAVARGFAEAGANVVIWYHSNKEAETRAKEIEEEFDVHCEC